MLLANKVAVVYGVGPIGGAAARAFAREGARVYLAARTRERLDRLAEKIRSGGGRAEAASLDALDEPAVDGYVDGVVAEAGQIDISFNAIGYGDVQQPLTGISVDDFLQPIVAAMRSQFLTTRAAARHMVPRGSGVTSPSAAAARRRSPGSAVSRSRWTPWRACAANGRAS
jgi:NAD(P)-dependent dehydrogenase (short-subunit alcohol dehydrogenase family)